MRGNTEQGIYGETFREVGRDALDAEAKQGIYGMRYYQITGFAFILKAVVICFGVFLFYL